MKIIDTHAHIYFEHYKDDLDEVIKEINEKMDAVVNIGCDIESSIECIKLANEHKKMFAVVGFHPVDIKKYKEGDDLVLSELVKTEDKVVAIGEIGLDYYWMEDPKEIQQKFFRLQLNLAEKLDLPVVIHTRDALEDTINILKEFKNVRGILHCYPGSYELAKPLLDRFYIGVGGVVTFKNNKKTKELVKQLPIDRIVLETDSPYLTPVPFRGKRNSPTYVQYVAEEIARIKEMSVEDVVNITSKNALKIYNIGKWFEDGNRD